MFHADCHAQMSAADSSNVDSRAFAMSPALSSLDSPAHTMIVHAGLGCEPELLVERLQPVTLFVVLLFYTYVYI